MGRESSKTPRTNDEAMNQEEIAAMMIQLQNESVLPSLINVTRKLGEVEGMISMQSDPSEDLLNAQQDFKRVYDKLLDEAGVELPQESENMGIGSDRCL